MCFDKIGKKNVGEFLKEKRIEAGFSQAEVSEILGFTGPQFVSNWERGIALPRVKDMKRIGKLLMVNEPEFRCFLLLEVKHSFLRKYGA